MNKHRLYKTEDVDAPDSIRDRNGDVVLGLCRICGRGEIELEEPCGPRVQALDTLTAVVRRRDAEIASLERELEEVTTAGVEELVARIKAIPLKAGDLLDSFETDAKQYAFNVGVTTMRAEVIRVVRAAFIK